MKTARMLSSLVLGCSLALAPVVLGAQAHEAPAAAHDSQKSEAHAAPKADDHAAQGHGEGHAAGGEAHHAAPAVTLFGAAGGPAIGEGTQLVLKFINFFVFAGLIGFLVAGKAKAGFKAKAEELTEALARAEKDKAEGEAQIRELEAKMAGLQGELDGILGKADADAKAEKERILEAARAEAGAIVAQAQADIAHHQRLAEQELRALVAELAVEGATKRIEAQMQTGAAGTVMDRAIQQVGGVQ